MNNLPLISVIVPIYNVDSYLSICIDSIVNQSYRNLEILLINDGSTDNSEKICHSYAQIDKRIHYVYQNNSGVSSTRNTGLSLAKGDFIYFIDADDYIHPQTIETLYKALNEGNYDFSMILGTATYKLDNKPVQIPNPFNKKILDQNYLMKGLFNLAKEEELQYQVVWNKLYKKEIIKDTYFINTGSEDTEFNCRIYQKCDKAILIKIPLYNWVQRSTSITHQAINNNYIDRMNSYYHCLLSIPLSQRQYRDYCLEKLYKIMINIRFYAEKTRYKEVTDSYIKKIYNNTFAEFWKSNTSCLKKMGLFIFYTFPTTYKIFMYLIEKSKLL